MASSAVPSLDLSLAQPLTLEEQKCAIQIMEWLKELTANQEKLKAAEKESSTAGTDTKQKQAEIAAFQKQIAKITDDLCHHITGTPGVTAPLDERVLCKLTNPSMWQQDQWKASADHDSLWQKYFDQHCADQIAAFCHNTKALQKHWQDTIQLYHGVRDQTMQPLQLQNPFDTLRGLAYAQTYTAAQAHPDADNHENEVEHLHQKAIAYGHFHTIAVRAKDTISNLAADLGAAETAHYDLGATTPDKFIQALTEVAQPAKQHLTPGYLLLATLCSYAGKYYALHYKQANQKDTAAKDRMLTLCQTYYQLSLQYLETALQLQAQSVPEIRNSFWGMPLHVGFFGGQNTVTFKAYQGLFALGDTERAKAAAQDPLHNFAVYLGEAYCLFTRGKETSAQDMAATTKEFVTLAAAAKAAAAPEVAKLTAQLASS